MKNIIKRKKIDPGWNFDNSYSRLPNTLYSVVRPTPVKSPQLLIINEDLCKNIGLNFSNISKDKLSDIFSGNKILDGSKNISQAYAGHQFGNFTMLGDGRASMIGEHITPKNVRIDIQLKGSGITPYSRGGDGRAALGPMLREYLISEAMYGLKIPTTRSLALVSTGEFVRRENLLDGAILTRTASSHLRIGTFQYLNMQNDIKTLKKLVTYSLKRHYPEVTVVKNEAITLLKCVINKQIDLVINWMRVGFIHSVCNTDNITISGETIDYGPCAFMNSYNPSTSFSSIDIQGRYSFGNQPLICHWNLSRFAESLIPILDDNEKKSLLIGREIIDEFNLNFKDKYNEMMVKKLGFLKKGEKNIHLMNELIKWMQSNKADYTNTFNSIDSDEKINDKIYQKDSFLKIKNKWKDLILISNFKMDNCKKLMKKNNPIVIPRNHKVELAITNIVKEKDFTVFNKILKTLKNPYKKHPDNDFLINPPRIEEDVCFKTFCGT